MRSRFRLDLDAGFLVAASAAVYAAVVGALRGLSQGMLSRFSYAILIAIFGVAGMIVGSVIAGRPDFGPNRRAALVRGFVAALPVYACGGLLFLPATSWFTLIPLLSLLAAVLVGPPIGIFMFRLHRRLDSPDSTAEESGQLAWLKGELLGSWTPLLISVALLAALGVGMRVVPEVDPSEIPQPRPDARMLIPDLYRALKSDPLDPQVRYELGRALASLGRTAEALDHLSRAVEIDSTEPDYWLAFAYAAFYGGQWERAGDACWRALRLDASAIGRAGVSREIFKTVIQDAAGGEAW
ncbi:MAG: hypothetical protein JSW71_04730 [Gemmatimonadota bacterium]|nr:MAG: hypothetical protein JSW71_04730 [Gemmatimonadota bacterium]